MSRPDPGRSPPRWSRHCSDNAADADPRRHASPERRDPPSRGDPGAVGRAEQCVAGTIRRVTRRQRHADSSSRRIRSCDRTADERDAASG